MKLLVVFLLLSNILSFSPLPHDAPIGVFNLYVNQHKVSMEIHLDKDDLETAVDFPKATLIEENVGAYINTHLKVELDDRLNTLEICSIDSDHLHYYIKGEFPSAPWGCKKVKVQNSCLIEIEQKQSNLLHINSEKGRRSFRLHKDRQETVLEF